MVDLKHYVEVLKKHEETRASTNERTAYWKKYMEDLQKTKNVLPIPKSLARFEHG
jgi:uncharacterized protein YifE (UPF0438 family)